jgi:hypothetical protein
LKWGIRAIQTFAFPLSSARKSDQATERNVVSYTSFLSSLSLFDSACTRNLESNMDATFSNAKVAKADVGGEDEAIEA